MSLHPPRCRPVLASLPTCGALLVVPLLLALPTAVVAQQAATLEGRVTDGETGEPLAYAVVSVPGAGLQTLTVADGTFRLRGLGTGRHVLEVRSIGYGLHRREVEMTAGAVARVEVELTAAPIAIDGVGAEVDRRRADPRMAGFWRRMERAQGLGRFFTRDDIEQRGASRLSDMFVGMPGVRIVQNAQRTGRYISFGRNDCPAMLYVDGIPMSIGEMGVDHIHLDGVEGVEVYEGSARVPAEFNRTSSAGVRFEQQASMPAGGPDLAPMNYRGDARCGVVVVWSRTTIRPRR